MSKYTTELRYICESVIGLDESKGYGNVNDIITQARPLIFDFEYPIFDENYKGVLETKILKHYYTREICAETYGLWKLFLDRKLNEIMPYYNQLYESELLKFNPFIDTNLIINNSRNRNENNIRNSSGTANGTVSNVNTSGTTGNSVSNNSSKGWNLYNDTPQGGIENIEDMSYLTNATKDTSENLGVNYQSSKGTSTDVNTSSNSNKSIDVGNLTSVDKYVENLVGKRGGDSYSKLLDEFRKTFLNIDVMIIDDLQNLFFKLW